VFWEGEDKWFEGVFTKNPDKSTKGLYPLRIEYQDGDVERARLKPSAPGVLLAVLEGSDEDEEDSEASQAEELERPFQLVEPAAKAQGKRKRAGSKGENIEEDLGPSAAQIRSAPAAALSEHKGVPAASAPDGPGQPGEAATSKAAEEQGKGPPGLGSSTQGEPTSEASAKRARLQANQANVLNGSMDSDQPAAEIDSAVAAQPAADFKAVSAGLPSAAATAEAQESRPGSSQPPSTNHSDLTVHGPVDSQDAAAAPASAEDKAVCLAKAPGLIRKSAGTERTVVLLEKPNSSKPGQQQQAKAAAPSGRPASQKSKAMSFSGEARITQGPRMTPFLAKGSTAQQQGQGLKVKEEEDERKDGAEQPTAAATPTLYSGPSSPHHPKSGSPAYSPLRGPSPAYEQQPPRSSAHTSLAQEALLLSMGASFGSAPASSGHTSSRRSPSLPPAAGAPAREGTGSQGASTLQPTTSSNPQLQQLLAHLQAATQQQPGPGLQSEEVKAATKLGSVGATVKLTKLAAAIPSKGQAAKGSGADAEGGSVIANHIVSKGKGSKELTVFSSKLTTLTRGLEVITAAANAGIEAARVGVEGFLGSTTSDCQVTWRPGRVPCSGRPVVVRPVHKLGL
jgi:hypothetical protein